MVTLRPRPSLHYPRQPLHEFLRVTADRHGERVALRYDSECFTDRDLDARGTTLATPCGDSGSDSATASSSPPPTAPSG